MINWPPKDPDEVLDYQINWADADKPVLQVGETIATSVWSVASGTITINSSSFVPGGITTVWLSGGADGTSAVLRNLITTSAGRTYDQAAKVRVRSNER